MKTVMIGAYAKMIKDKLCTIEDIPEEYRDAVATYSESPKSVTPIETAKEVSNESYGALFLGKQEISVQAGDTISVNISTDSVFNGHLEDGQPMPSGLRYSIGLVENTFRKFETTPVVTISNTGVGFIMEVSGKMTNIISGAKLLRVDVNIGSYNYEDMVQTIYLIAK